MRILHVVSSLSEVFGGPAKMCRELCGELAKRGESVTIFTTDWNGHHHESDFAKEWSPPPGLDVRVFRARFPKFVWFSSELWRALEREIPSYDIVHDHMLYCFPSSAAAYFCRRFKVPYVTQPHGALDPFIFRRHRVRKWIFESVAEWKNFNGATAIMYTAEQERMLAGDVGVTTPGVVVPIGLDLRDYDDPSAAGEFRRAWPAIGDRKIILFLGRLNFKKGLDLLVRAFAAVCRRRDDVVLVLAGPDGGLEAEVRQWLTEERVLDRAFFTGMLRGPLKTAALYDCDLFALPSHAENFAIAMVEAMACGRPVLLSNRIDLWREVADASAGLVVNPEVGEVTSALFRLLEDPELAARLGANARRLVQERFRLEEVAARTLAVYRDLVRSSAVITETQTATTTR